AGSSAPALNIFDLTRSDQIRWKRLRNETDTMWGVGGSTPNFTGVKMVWKGDTLLAARRDGTSGRNLTQINFKEDYSLSRGSTNFQRYYGGIGAANDANGYQTVNQTDVFNSPNLS